MGLDTVVLQALGSLSEGFLGRADQEPSRCAALQAGWVDASALCVGLSPQRGA